MRKPGFIGIGVQKCATTWLYRMLSNHPQIALAWPGGCDRDKDIKFFNYFYDRGIEWYEHHFDNCQGDVVGEYSTTYFYNTEAPERIYKYSPDMKLIVSLRHPVERAFSNHKFEIRLGRISGDNIVFENALENNPMYLHQSLYYAHLSQWLRYFHRNQIYLIIVDDLRHDSLQVLQGLYRFLNVSAEHMPVMHSQRVHQTRMPKNDLVELLTTKTIQLARLVRLSGLIESFKKMGVKSAMDKVINKKESEVFPPMRSKTRRRLLDYFADDVDRLSTFLDRDLSAWRK
jgi:hypothetical protein